MEDGVTPEGYKTFRMVRNMARLYKFFQDELLYLAIIIIIISVCMVQSHLFK